MNLLFFIIIIIIIIIITFSVCKGDATYGVYI